MSRTQRKPKPKPRRKRLPKVFRGARVVRGLGMISDKLDRLVEEKALTRFDWFDKPQDLWIVVENACLRESAFSSTHIKAFIDEASALRYARACGNGNVNQRVLHVTDQTLVVATESELASEDSEDFFE